MVQEIKILEERSTSVCNIYKRNDGIIQIVLFDRVDIDIEQSREMFNIIKTYSKKPKDLLVLVVAGKYTTTTKEVREFSATDEASSITFAEAIILHSLAQKMIINFILNFHKPKRHMKMFTNENDAVEWLYSMKKKMK